jgi:hypothetical protein
MFALEAALMEVSPRYFLSHAIDARTALAMIHSPLGRHTRAIPISVSVVRFVFFCIYLGLPGWLWSELQSEISSDRVTARLTRYSAE